MILRATRPDEIAHARALEAAPEAAPFVVGWTEAQHRAALDDPDQAHLALERNGELTGFVLLAGLRSPDHSIELRRIVVTPAGAGWGAEALELVIARAFGELAAHRLWLDVKVDNPRAQRAYARAGFRREGVLRDALCVDGRYEPLIVMSLLDHERSPAACAPAPGSGQPRPATRRDFAEILGSLPAFWGDRDVAHLHHPMAIEEFGDGALVIEEGDGRVAAYLFGMLLPDRGLGYVHVIAVRHDVHSRGLGRALYAAFAGRAAARGCGTLKAITRPENAGSMAFHRALGMDAREVADYSGPGQARVVFTGACDTVTEDCGR